MEDELKRRLGKLEEQREEDRKELAQLRRDMAELVAEMRVSNAYAKELYKRTEKGEEELDEQGKALGELSKVILKNQPAVDSVNRIKAGLIGVVFTVLAAVIVNWFVASKEPPVNEHEYKQLLTELQELRRHEREAH
ncbi:hypothetical protein [Vibrio phage CKB-S2]|nr:hypothetical protein [Vibrio phage CKB-S2]